jgi:hypothetical protein
MNNDCYIGYGAYKVCSPVFIYIVYIEYTVYMAMLRCECDVKLIN